MCSFVIPNEVLLSRAVQTVSQGHIAVIPVRGTSMLPFIIGGKDSVELYPPFSLRVGDIVLARFESGAYLLHRIYALGEEDKVLLMGDGNIGTTESCHRSQILAKARFVIRHNGKKQCLDSYSMRQAFYVWKLLIPCRRILLRLFRCYYK